MEVVSTSCLVLLKVVALLSLHREHVVLVDVDVHVLVANAWEVGADFELLVGLKDVEAKLRRKLLESALLDALELVHRVCEERVRRKGSHQAAAAEAAAPRRGDIEDMAKGSAHGARADNPPANGSNWAS